MNDLNDRLIKFAVKAIKFLRTLPVNDETKIIRYQLIKSSSSSVQIMKNHKQDLQRLILEIKSELHFAKQENQITGSD